MPFRANLTHGYGFEQAGVHEGNYVRYPGINYTDLSNHSRDVARGFPMVKVASKHPQCLQLVSAYALDFAGTPQTSPSTTVPTDEIPFQKLNTNPKIKLNVLEYLLCCNPFLLVRAVTSFVCFVICC